MFSLNVITANMKHSFLKCPLGTSPEPSSWSVKSRLVQLSQAGVSEEHAGPEWPCSGGRMSKEQQGERWQVENKTEQSSVHMHDGYAGDN